MLAACYMLTVSFERRLFTSTEQSASFTNVRMCQNIPKDTIVFVSAKSADPPEHVHKEQKN